VVEIDGRAYVAYPMVEGRHAPRGDSEAARLAGAALARLHEITRHYAGSPPNPRPPMRDRFLNAAAQTPMHVEAVHADASLESAHGLAAWLASAWTESRASSAPLPGRASVSR